MTSLALAAVLAVGIGGALGVLGGGGSILLVPVLVYVLGLEPAMATATSLVVVLVTSIAALVPHARAGNVRWTLGLRFGALSMTAAWLGARVSLLLPGTLLLILLGLVMAATAFSMLRRPIAQEPPPPLLAPPSLLRTAPVALAVGALAGVLGAGGGFLAVPALAVMLRLPFLHAVGTSLVVIALGAIAGLVGRIDGDALDVVSTVVITIGSVFGSLVGSHLARDVPAARLRAGLGWLLGVVAAGILGRELFVYGTSFMAT